MVDDYEPWRRFASSTFQKMPGLQVVGEVSDGLQAVKQSEELQPDLILLDIALPTINGIEAARRIRKHSPRSKILFFSEERSPDIAEEALRTGAVLPIPNKTSRPADWWDIATSCDVTRLYAKGCFGQTRANGQSGGRHSTPCSRSGSLLYQTQIDPIQWNGLQRKALFSTRPHHLPLALPA